MLSGLFLFLYFLPFYLYINYFYAPEDIQFGEKLSNHPIKPHFRPLLGRFVTTFLIPPAFSVFVFLPRAPLFFPYTPRPIWSLLRL